MTGELVDLDRLRAMAAQKATEVRRRRLDILTAGQRALSRHREELDGLLRAAPAQTWPEAAAKARYIIQLFAETQEARDPRCKELITQALDDLTRLCDRATEIG